MRGRQCSSSIDSSSNIADDDGLLCMKVSIFDRKVKFPIVTVVTVVRKSSGEKFPTSSGCADLHAQKNCKN
jgi:hypothetical protein